MTAFRAIVFDAETGAEGRYDFEGSFILQQASAMRVARAFFESETAKTRILTLFPEWEINTAFKHEDCWVVTLTGTLIRASGRRVPFMAMISTEDAVESYAARSG